MKARKTPLFVADSTWDGGAAAFARRLRRAGIRSRFWKAFGRRLVRTLSSASVSLGEEGDRVGDAKLQALAAGALLELQVAAGIAGGHDARTGLPNALQFAVEE